MAFGLCEGHEDQMNFHKMLMICDYLVKVPWRFIKRSSFYGQIYYYYATQPSGIDTIAKKLYYACDLSENIRNYLQLPVAPLVKSGGSLIWGLWSKNWFYLVPIWRFKHPAYEVKLFCVWEYEKMSLIKVEGFVK